MIISIRSTQTFFCDALFLNILLKYAQNLRNLHLHRTFVASKINSIMQHSEVKAKHKFWGNAYRAHTGTSFSPEKRADDYCREYDEQLAYWKAEVEKLGGDPADYEAKYERHWLAWMSAKSRCISSMITGGSNFPVRRAEKANNAEHARMNEFIEFKEKYIARLKKAKHRAERAGIDPIEEKREELAKAKDWHEKMKQVNAICRKKITQDEKIALLAAIGIKEALANELITVKPVYGAGFQQFELTNSLARIKDMEQRLAIMKKKAATPVSEVERPDGIRVVHNTEADRLQIFFPGKPDANRIGILKRNAYKWSPSNGCWQRQLTPNAVASLKSVLPE